MSSDQFRLTSGDALLIVDVQNDFLPGGRLAVPEGGKIIPALNQYIDLFTRRNLPVYATRDWHLQNHCSFREQGGIWPAHCIAHTHGAEFSNELKLPDDTIIISKGTDSRQEAYSGFQGTQLHTLLKENGIRRLFVGGLATDYCVLNTVKDALSHGFQVALLIDAIQAVNVKPGDAQRAMGEMESLGAKLVHS